MDLMNLPKIELHCHLDGSLRAKTIIDLAREDGINIPSFDISVIEKNIIAPLECKSLDEYLKRFVIPISVMQSKKSLKRASFELFEDAAQENVKYMEVRFAPLLHTMKGLELEEIIQSVLDGIRNAEKKYPIRGNLILSCMRTMPVEKAFDVVEAGKKFLGKGVVAIDLCSSEEKDFCRRFIEPITLARNYGYRVTIHAGETGIGENVLDAIEFLGAERIGHGVFIKDCIEAYKTVKEKQIPLEICLTSNIQTKAVQNFNEHPIYNFYKDGIKVTINTDNRTVSNTNMTHECNILHNKFNITSEDYKKIYFDSIEASFADSDIKKHLKSFQNVK